MKFLVFGCWILGLFLFMFCFCGLAAFYSQTWSWKHLYQEPSLNLGLEEEPPWAESLLIVCPAMPAPAGSQWQVLDFLRNQDIRLNDYFNCNKYILL